MTLIEYDDLQLRFDLPEFDDVSEDADEKLISPEEARKISEAARTSFENGRPGPDWLADYLTLRSNGWPWRVAAYIAWASSPKIKRWPGTLNELATNVLGLKSARVIYTWRKNSPTIDTKVSMLQTKDLWEHRKEVIRALVAVAIQPDYKGHADRRLYLEMTGDYTPKSESKLAVDAADLSHLSDAQIDRLLGSKLDQLIIDAEKDDGND